MFIFAFRDVWGESLRFSLSQHNCSVNLSLNCALGAERVNGSANNIKLK